MVAGAVMLVSIVQFYREQKLFSELLDQEKFFVASTGLVYRWKLWGSIYMSATGTGLCLLTLLVHFDTVCLPRLWKSVFQDGSTAERNLILFFILFWAANVHICTSSLSVGESQANTFFTAWIAFGSIALNYTVWRESAGLPSLADKVNFHQRETTYNWIWTGIFSAVFAGSATDIFINREEITLRLRDEILVLENKEWVIVLAVVWTEVAVCIMAVLFNEWFPQPMTLPGRIQCRGASYRCVLGWRQLEGPIVLAALGTKFWVILEYTGVGGVVNGLSNGYFGVWGSFFNSVFTLGTWLRENKNIEYIVREESDEDEHRVNS
jgi:hypothetical protein